MKVDDLDLTFSTATAKETIGPRGGKVYLGDVVVITVPFGAVSDNVEFTYRCIFDKNPKPNVDLSDEIFILSPIIELGPDNTFFKKFVSIRFPFSAAIGGWTLFLIKQVLESGNKNEWMKLLTIDTDTLQVKTNDSNYSYDLKQRQLLLKHCCRLRMIGCCRRRSTKIVVTCLLYARIDSSCHGIHFILYLAQKHEEVLKVSVGITKGKHGFIIVILSWATRPIFLWCHSFLAISIVLGELASRQSLSAPYGQRAFASCILSLAYRLDRIRSRQPFRLVV
jgi:hypothetical protein